MKQFMSTFTLSMLTLFCCAQQVIASAGSYNNNGSVSLSTTIGETVIATYVAANTTLTQGFQQPTYIVINSIAESSGELLQIKVYPNPTAGNIAIDLKNIQGDGMALTVTDLQGKIVLRQNMFTNTINAVDLQHEANASYLFIITDKNGGLLSTHQVQKIQ